MSFKSQMLERLAAIPSSQAFSVDNFNPISLVERQNISCFLSQLAKKKEIYRVDRGSYMRSFSKDEMSHKKRKKYTFKDKITEEVFSSAEDEIDSISRVDDSGRAVMGKKECIKEGILLKLTKTSLLELVANNEVSFYITLKCDNIQRNFQGEVVSLSLDAINIDIIDRFNKK